MSSLSLTGSNTPTYLTLLGRYCRDRAVERSDAACSAISTLQFHMELAGMNELLSKSRRCPEDISGDAICYPGLGRWMHVYPAKSLGNKATITTCNHTSSTDVRVSQADCSRLNLQNLQDTSCDAVEKELRNARTSF
jgi:hypothetical protein